MKTPNEALAEVLYFQLLFSYLLQKPDLKDYYEMLLDHYNHYPESFQVLTKNDLIRLKNVQEDIKNNTYSLFKGTLDFGTEPLAIKQEKEDIKHKELCFEIIKNRVPLFEPITGPLIFCSDEHPTAFGPIDILLQNNEGCAFIVEVKTDTAKHDIVSQVTKYFIGMSLKLILRFFDDIKIMTLCPGYDRNAHAGLRQLGARMFTFKHNPLSINEIAP